MRIFLCGSYATGLTLRTNGPHLSVTMAKISTVPEIIDAFGGNAAFSLVCRGPSTRATQHGGDLRSRNHIPLRFWPNIIMEAREKGLSIDAYTLIEAHTGAQLRPSFFQFIKGFG